MSNARLCHISVYAFLKKKYKWSNSYPFSLPNRFSILKQTKICLSENTSRRHDLIGRATIQGSWRKLQEVPSQKYEIFQMNNLLLSTRNTPLRNTNGLRQDIQVSDDITPPTLYSEEEVEAPEGVLHRRQLEEYPILSSCCLPRGESLQAQSSNARPEWRLQDMKDDNEIGSTSVTICDSLHSYLIHATKKEEHRTMS